MLYRSIRGFTGFSQFGILLAFTGLGLVLAGIAQYLIGLMIVPAGTPASQMPEAIATALFKPENTGMARLSQVMGTLFLMFLPALFYLLICHGRNGFWLGFNRYINPQQVLIGFILIFCANIIAAPLANLSKSLLAHFPGWDAVARKMENDYNRQVTVLSNLKSWTEFGMAIVIMAFFPALFEELFFRGALQNLLERWWKAPWVAVIATSLVFSLIHMSVYLFLSRFILGFVLGLMYQRSKNIWVNIIAHFLNNTVAVIQLFWLSRQGKKIEADKLDGEIPLILAGVCVILIVGLFLLFEKASAKNRTLVAFEEQNLWDNSDLNRSIAS